MLMESFTLFLSWLSKAFCGTIQVAMEVMHFGIDFTTKLIERKYYSLH